MVRVQMERTLHDCACARNTLGTRYAHMHMSQSKSGWGYMRGSTSPIRGLHGVDGDTKLSNHRFNMIQCTLKCPSQDRLDMNLGLETIRGGYY